MTKHGRRSVRKGSGASGHPAARQSQTAATRPAAEGVHRAILSHLTRSIADPDHPGVRVDLHTLQLRRSAEAYRRQQPQGLSSF